MRELPRTAPLPEQELRALVEVVLLVAYADGKLSMPELDKLVERGVELSGQQRDRAAIEGMIHEVKPADPLLRAWRSQRLASLKQILVDDEVRRTAFVVALEVALADGRIGHRETTTLAAAAAEFGLDAGVVLELLARVQNAEA